MANDDQNPLRCCFSEWLKLEEEDHEELLQTLTLFSNRDNPVEEVLLNQLIEKNVTHFEEYAKKRSQLAHDYASPLFAASWCNSLESSLLWIAGCRPSTFIRLIYACMGSEGGENIIKFIEGKRTGSLCELSGRQLSRLNSLQVNTILKETNLTNQLACLQDDIADQPFPASAVKNPSCVGEGSEVIAKALEKHDRSMEIILEMADKLRLNTLKDLIHILTPQQGVEFLAASKKLRLGIREWGQIRDCQHGI